jgi:transcriptional regulator with XRE-family HTH domain
VSEKVIHTALRATRDRRGLTQDALCRLSGCSDATVRRAERDPARASSDTLRCMLDALATVAPFSLVETAELSAEIGWTFEAVEQISAQARPAAASERGPGRERIDRALAALEDHADPLGDLLDALARLCVSVSDRAQTDLLRDDRLPELARTLAHTHLIELKAETDASGGSRFTATLPASVPTAGGAAPVVYHDAAVRPLRITPDEPLPTPTIRVVRKPERTADGALIERFEYYKPDGTRLIPSDELPAPKPARRTNPGAGPRAGTA